MISCCNDILFSMKMDIYYSTTSQDKFNKEIKEWSLDKTVIGYAEILGAVEIDGLKTDQFFQYKDKLIGRTKEDPRISVDGIMHPITDIIITNIRDSKNGTEFYIESSGVRSGQSTIYELFSVEPYVNPWNTIEYYKILFNRSDIQEIFND